MMKNAGGIIALVIILFGSQMALPASAADPEIEKGAKVTLSGVLTKGIMAVGGETTGWLLEYQTAAGTQTIQVDPTNLKPDKIPEGNVAVKGEIVERSYLQSGPTLILKAAKIRPKRVKTI